MVLVLLQGRQIDEDVVYEHELVQQISEDIMHEMQEHTGCIIQSERNDGVLKVTIACLEGHLPLISSSNSDKVIGSPQVQLGKDLGHSMSSGMSGRGYQFHTVITLSLR